jgi:hypothetical protein
VSLKHVAPFCWDLISQRRRRSGEKAHREYHGDDRAVSNTHNYWCQISQDWSIHAAPSSWSTAPRGPYPLPSPLGAMNISWFVRAPSGSVCKRLLYGEESYAYEHSYLPGPQSIFACPPSFRTIWANSVCLFLSPSPWSDSGRVELILGRSLSHFFNPPVRGSSVQRCREIAGVCDSDDTHTARIAYFEYLPA